MIQAATRAHQTSDRIPVKVLLGLKVTLGVRQAPRCPWAAAWIAAIHVWLLGRHWGTP